MVSPSGRPLADKMRPHSLDQVAGQDHLLGAGKPLRLAIESGNPHSMVLWGPPGSGKTTLARIAAHYSDAQFVSLSAVLDGVKQVRAAVDQARTVAREQGQRGTILFVDEVHRFNKAQQDAFLPFVEDGTVILIGATTENPSFALNNALLSRVRVYVLRDLQLDDLSAVLKRALNDASNAMSALARVMGDDELQNLARAADGDARRVLVLLEIVADLFAANGQDISTALAEATRTSLRRFDQRGDIFYDQISALHKSVRGSNPDAALYWYARMLDGGCDPQYIARRVLRIASEDIGNADPRALAIALDAYETYRRLGSPEGELAIAQALVYQACAAKSNALYRAYQMASADVSEFGSLEVPLHLRNAPTELMKSLGHGAGYRYAHDEDAAYSAAEQYFPDGLTARRYYEPVARGLEIKIAQKLEYLRNLDAQAQQKKSV